MGPSAESRPIRVVSLWNWREHTKCSPSLLQDSSGKVTKWQRERSCVHNQNCEEQGKRLVLGKADYSWNLSKQSCYPHTMRLKANLLTLIIWRFQIQLFANC